MILSKINTKETIKIKKSQIRTCVKNAQISKRQNGMFIPYEFIGFSLIDQKFYSSVQPSSNSWTNYPGVKVWNNNGQATEGTKSELVDYIFNYVLTEMELEHPDLDYDFEFTDN